MPPALPTVCVVNKSRWGSHSLEEGWETSASLLPGKHRFVISVLAATLTLIEAASRGGDGADPAQALLPSLPLSCSRQISDILKQDTFRVWELLGHVSQSGRIQEGSNIWLMDTPWSVFVRFVHWLC